MKRLRSESLENTENTVIRIVSDHLGIPSATLSRTTNILNDLSADSLDLVELVMTVEEKFDITIDDEMAQGVERIEDLICAVVTLIAAREEEIGAYPNETGEAKRKDET